MIAPTGWHREGCQVYHNGEPFGLAKATEAEAEAYLERVRKRYENGLPDLATYKRGGPYLYSFPEDYEEYLEGTPIKRTGLLQEKSRVAAKDYMRYRLERAGVGQDNIRSLMVVLDLEPV